MNIQANEESTLLVQCTRCRNRHTLADRVSQVIGEGRWARVCPRCRGASYHDVRPQAAWCWASGLIEMGDPDRMPDGAILVATGAKAFLVGTLAALARIGRGANEGSFLVPGVPEAPTQGAKGDALATWLKWCAKNNGQKYRHGVTFVMPTR